MIKNHNGYWMSPKFYAQFAPDGGDGGNAGGAEAGTGTEVAEEGADGTDGAEDTEAKADDKAAEIARLNAEMLKLKAAMDKAASEAAAAKKALKSKMTSEEIAAKEKEEADEKTAKELEELRKKVAKGETVKGIMGKLNLGEEAASSLADCLYGAADIENALLEVQKAWQAREKALRLEYGKITGPGAGGDSNSPEAQAIARAREIGNQQSAVNDQAQKAINAYLR